MIFTTTNRPRIVSDDNVELLIRTGVLRGSGKVLGIKFSLDIADDNNLRFEIV